MANGLETTCTVTASIPTYVADGMTGPVGGIYTLTFSGGAPPTDGSVGLAFVTLSIANIAWRNGGSQFLIYYRSGAASGVGTEDLEDVPFGGTYYQAKVPSWVFASVNGQAE